MLVDLKADWPELSTGMGLPSHSSKHAPCMFCTLDQDHIRKHNPPLPLPTHDAGYYSRECDRHEFTVHLASAEQYRKLRFRTEFKSTSRGRSVARDIPDLGVVKGDRIEPTRHLLDTADFDRVATDPFIPFTITMWRPTDDMRVYHRNPLMDPALGTGLNSFSIDELHTLHLGVFQSWTATVIWRLIDFDVFKTGCTVQDDRVRLGLRHFKIVLDGWYSDQRAKGIPERKITRIGDLTPGMIGKRGNPTLSTKAAETKWLFFCVIEVFERFAGELPSVCNAQSLLLAGKALLRYHRILEHETRKVSDELCGELNNLCMMHCSLASAAGVQMMPKHHMFRHMADMIKRKGNPKYYHVYLDESLNGKISKIASTTHRARFERMVFRKFGLLESRGRELGAEGGPVAVAVKRRSGRMGDDNSVPVALCCLRLIATEMTAFAVCNRDGQVGLCLLSAALASVARSTTRQERGIYCGDGERPTPQVVLARQLGGNGRAQAKGIAG